MWGPRCGLLFCRPAHGPGDSALSYWTTRDLRLTPRSMVTSAVWPPRSGAWSKYIGAASILLAPLYSVAPRWSPCPCVSAGNPSGAFLPTEGQGNAYPMGLTGTICRISFANLPFVHSAASSERVDAAPSTHKARVAGATHGMPTHLKLHCKRHGRVPKLSGK
jgi:hypothetical protein